jgi:hypothetical protein
MARLRFFIVLAFVLAMVGCPNATLPENTISFTLDGVDYSYTASANQSTHAWGAGYGDPPTQYSLTASKSEADAIDPINTIRLTFLLTGGYWDLSADVFDAVGDVHTFDLGTADDILLHAIVKNLDTVGGQMQGAFLGDYEFVNSSTHTLTSIMFSVERLIPLNPQ